MCGRAPWRRMALSRRAYSAFSVRPTFAGGSNFIGVCQPPDERPDRHSVDVPDVLGEVDCDRLVPRIVTVGAEL